MTKQEFRNWLFQNIVLLDGATGSNLQKKGMPTGVCPEAWITEHPDALKELQVEYVNAGSNIVYAPTFTANRIKLKEYGLEDRIEEINTKLVKISKESVDGKALVAGDITMTGAQLEPMGDLTFEELVDVYRQQIAILYKAGIDLLGVETMMSLQETRAAVLAAKEVCPDLPMIATLSFTEAGSTLYGASVESAVVVLQSLGVDAVGLNCSAGPDKMLSNIERMKKLALVPIIAKPNAGLPKVSPEGQTIYDMKADTFADYMTHIMEAGANLVGGCCGTDPEYIRNLKENSLKVSSVPECAPESVYLANEREIYAFEDGQEINLGDGIDYRSDEDMQEEFEDEVFDTAEDTAFELQDDEVDALMFIADGLENEADILVGAVNDVTGVVRMPAVIATSNPETAETVLRAYSGVVALMCLSEDVNVQNEMEIIRKRYGAARVSIDKKITCC